MKTNIFYKYLKAKNNNINANTIVFLHGWQSSSDAFLCSANHFNQEYNILLIDFLGFGKSEVPSKPLDTFLHAISIYELLVNLNLKNLIIVGHSFGGRVAVLLSSLFNVNLKGLVLVGSAGIIPRRSIWYHIKVKSFKICKKLVSNKILPKRFLNIFGSKDYKETMGVMRISFIQIVNQNLKCFLKEIKTKTIIINGNKDKSVPLKIAKVFNKNIKNSTLCVMKGKGHYCFLEDKKQFNKIIGNFLILL